MSSFFASSAQHSQQHPHSDRSDPEPAASAGTGRPPAAKANVHRVLRESAGHHQQQQQPTGVVVPGELPQSPSSSQSLAHHRQPIRQTRIRSHNSSIYFSDSDDDDDDDKQQHTDALDAANVDNRRSWPVARNHSAISDAHFWTASAFRPSPDHPVDRPSPDEDDADDSPSAPSSFRQQFHRRHRQFHRTIETANASTSTSRPPPTDAADASTEEDAGDALRPASSSSSNNGPRQSPGAHSRKPNRSVSRSPNKRPANRPPVEAERPDEHPLRALLRIRYQGLVDRRELTRTMLLGYGAETICVLAFILTTLATFQNASPKLGRVPAAPAFFARGSVVHDFPGGNLDYVHAHVKTADISLVMFYAPWSAECQHARTSFEQTARLFHEQLFFASVNCWQPGGECRAGYPKIHDWPVLMAYHQRGLAIPYTGRWTTASLVRFVGGLMRPVHRLTSRADLQRLIVDHDHVVVALLPDFGQLTQRRVYNVFHGTAVKWLERDPFQTTAFAVVTGASVREFDGEAQTPMLHVHQWNGTLMEEFYGDTTKDELHSWIVGLVAGVQVAGWLQPPIAKATSFRAHLRNGPLLIVFTPRNAIAASGNDAYRMLRQVALLYANCERSPEVARIGRTVIAERRRDDRAAEADFRAECQRLLAVDARNVAECYRSAEDVDCDGLVSVTAADRSRGSHAMGVMNSSNVRADGRIVGSAVGCSMGVRNVHERCIGDVEPIEEGCSSVRDRWQSPAASNDEFTTSRLDDGELDQRSVRRIAEQRMRKRCELLHSSEQLNDYPQSEQFEWSADGLLFDKIEASACGSNHSLGFVAIDSIMYDEFAVQLGVDVRLLPHRTAVVIVDKANESTFVHSGPLTTESLIEFVHNYTQQQLLRHLKNEPDRNSERRLQRSRRVDLPPKTARSAELPARVHDAVELRDLDSETFVSSVQQSKKAVIVLFYSMQCAMCTSMLHALLLTAHHLSAIREHVDFVRIDADRNDLPWHYTVERLPTLIAFPPGRRSADSRIYPPALATSMPNVLAFVLSNLDRPVRLHGMLSVCNSVRTKYGMPSDCARNIRTEIRDDIAFSLREWRTSKLRRRAIVRRLQALQRLLLRMHRPDTTNEADMLAELRNVRKVWHG